MGIHEIKSLMEKGERDEALIKIELSDENEIDLLLLKTRIIRKKEMYSSALTIAQDALTKSRDTKNKMQELGALILLADCMVLSGEPLEQIDELITLFEKNWNTLTGEQKEEAKEWEGYLYHVKGILCGWRLDHKNAIRNYELSLKIRENLEYKLDISNILNNLSYVYLQLGDNDMALEYAKQNISISQKFDNKPNIAWAFTRIGHLYLIKGEYDQASDYLDQALNLTNKYHFQYALAFNYETKGELYYFTGKFDQALTTFKKSLTLYEELNLNENISDVIYSLILTSLKMGSKKLANKYMDKFEKLYEKNDAVYINLMKIFSKAVILKDNPRVQYKIEAQQIFNKIVKENINPIVTIDAMLHLSELLLDELKLYGQEEVLKEVDVLMRQIYEIAQAQKRYPLIIEAMILRSKFAFLNLDLDLANKLLQQSHLVAEERGLDWLLKMVELEQNKLEKDIKAATVISRQAELIIDELNKSQIIDYINEMKKLISVSQ